MHEAYTATQLLKLPLCIESLCRYCLNEKRSILVEKNKLPLMDFTHRDQCSSLSLSLSLLS